MRQVGLPGAMLGWRRPSLLGVHPEQIKDAGGYPRRVNADDGAAGHSEEGGRPGTTRHVLLGSMCREAHGRPKGWHCRARSETHELTVRRRRAG